MCELEINAAGWHLASGPEQVVMDGACKVHKQHCKSHDVKCMLHQTQNNNSCTIDAQYHMQCCNQTWTVTPARMSTDAKTRIYMEHSKQRVQHASMEQTWLSWLSRGHLTRGTHDRGRLHLGSGEHHAWGRTPDPSCWASQTLETHSQHLVSMSPEHEHDSECECP